MKDTGITVARNISLLLQKNGRKQIELAEAIGVSKQTMSKILNGSRMVSISELKDIARYFHVSMEKLMEEEDTQNGRTGPSREAYGGENLFAQAGTEEKRDMLEALFELSDMILSYSELRGQ